MNLGEGGFQPSTGTSSHKETVVQFGPMVMETDTITAAVLDSTRQRSWTQRGSSSGFNAAAVLDSTRQQFWIQRGSGPGFNAAVVLIRL
jgi:hypothetical protein